MAAGTGFPYVLYDLLKKESSMVVMWTSTGTAFGIRDMTSFRQDVLTCYFKHNKFSSFQRQLNLYGFRKVVKGRESGCYMHPSFLRDHPEKLSEEPDLATHIRLGEMHISAAALAAARAQIKADGVDTSSSHAVAAARAAAHHLQVAQAHIGGSSGALVGEGPKSTGMGSVGHLSQASSASSMGPVGFLNAHDSGPVGLGSSRGGGSAGAGAGAGARTRAGGGSSSGACGGGSGGGSGSGGGDGGGVGAMGTGESSRGRPGRSSLSKMFGVNRRPTLANSMYSGGGGNGAGRSSGVVDIGGRRSSDDNKEQLHSGQRSPHMHNQLSRYGSLPGPTAPSMDHPHVHRSASTGHIYLPPLLANVQNSEGVGPSLTPSGSNHRGSPVESGIMKDGVGETPGHRSHASTAASLSRLLDGLGQTLDAPLEEEMYTPIEKRNSFCAQMMNIAQVLEDDMQGSRPSQTQSQTQTPKAVEEAKSSQHSYLAQKRRSSVSELAAYLHDMLEEGESSRLVHTVPGCNGRDSLNGAIQSRVAFKRTLEGDEGYVDGYGIKEGERGSEEGDGGGGSGPDPHRGLSRAFSKRAKGSPLSPSNATSAPCSSGSSSEGNRDGSMEDKLSERRISTVGATVVQALTCLASGLNDGSGDSDDGKEEAPMRRVDDPSERQDQLAWGSVPARDKSDVTVDKNEGKDARRDRGDKASVDGDAAGEGPVPVKTEENTEGSSKRASPTGKSEGDVDGEIHTSGLMPEHVRRGSAITDVLNNFSLDRALEQFKTENSGGGGDPGPGGDGGDAGEGEQQGLRQRASVYVLMHAIAAVDTANALETNGEEALEEVTRVSAAI